MSEAVAPIGHNNPPVDFRVELAERQAGLKLRAEALLAEAGAHPASIETAEQHEAAATTAKALAEILREVGVEHTKEKAPFIDKTNAIDEFFLTRGLKGRLEPVSRKIALLNGAYQQRLADARRKAAEEEAKAAADAAAAKAKEAADLEAAGRHTEAEVKLEGAMAQEQVAGQAAYRAGATDTDLGRSYTAAGTSSLNVTAKPVVDADKVDLEKLRPFLSIDALEAAVRNMARAKGMKHGDLLDGKMPIAGVTFERVAMARGRG